jgi:putative transposase
MEIAIPKRTDTAGRRLNRRTPWERREWLPYAYHHIYSRGNNRQNIFCDGTDMMEAYRLLTMIYNETPISICAFCFMTNHYHLLLKTEEVSISKIMGIFNKRYTDYFNGRYRHVGHIFQQRFNSSPVPYPQDLLQVSTFTVIPSVPNSQL